MQASKLWPNRDCTPNLETVFADVSCTGTDGVNPWTAPFATMSVSRINGFINKYKVPVSGSSYGVGFNMWDAGQHPKIMRAIKIVVARLSQVKRKTFGISVGKPKRLKTPVEPDAQDPILKQIIAVCNDHGIEANLHNHTYEVKKGMHDLEGTIKRIPGIRLGPDLTGSCGRASTRLILSILMENRLFTSTSATNMRRATGQNTWDRGLPILVILPKH